MAAGTRNGPKPQKLNDRSSDAYFGDQQSGARPEPHEGRRMRSVRVAVRL
jgi:hypothetical protein